jgi:hypothetical protein
LGRLALENLKRAKNPPRPPRRNGLVVAFHPASYRMDGVRARMKPWICEQKPAFGAVTSRRSNAPRKAANLAALPARILGFARVRRRTRQNTGFARAKRGATGSDCAPAAAAPRAFKISRDGGHAGPSRVAHSGQLVL